MDVSFVRRARLFLLSGCTCVYIAPLIGELSRQESIAVRKFTIENYNNPLKTSSQINLKRMGLVRMGFQAQAHNELISDFNSFNSSNAIRLRG